jgi:hypothetical protein
MLQEIEGSWLILPDDAARDRRRHFRTREELPITAQRVR